MTIPAPYGYASRGRDGCALNYTTDRPHLLGGQDILGLVKINLGRYEEAADALVKAYTYNPGWAETYYDNTTYGIHRELGADKEITLRLIKYIYPVNQHLARILYNNWARGNSAMKAGDVVTGFYSAALRLCGSFDFLPEAFTGVFLPVLSRQIASGWESFAAIFRPRIIPIAS